MVLLIDLLVIPAPLTQLDGLSRRAGAPRPATGRATLRTLWDQVQGQNDPGERDARGLVDLLRGHLQAIGPFLHGTQQPNTARMRCAAAINWSAVPAGI